MYSLVLSLIFCVLSSSSYCQTKKNVLKKGVLEFEEFTTMTGESVSCESFKSIFRKSIKKIVLSKDELNEVCSYQNKFISIKPRLIDVRVLLLLYNDKDVNEYCMDRFGVFVHCKTGKYFENKQLSGLIRAKCLPPNLRK